jgi:peroxiredoxin
MYAKEGYKISLRIPGAHSQEASSASEKKAYLILSGWNGNEKIDSTEISDKGEIKFSGKKSLKTGEYLIKWPGESVEIFLSDNSFANIRIEKRGKDFILKKGSEENSHFLNFQNLVNHKWQNLPDAAALRAKLDSTASLISVTGPEWLFNLMLNGEKGNLFIQDNRIANCRFGKKYLNNYIKEIEYNSIDTVISKVDKLLSVAADSIKAVAAKEIFRYFSKPQIMGQESVACHIAENHFMKGGLECTQSELFEMHTFVMLNGQSLVGMTAQDIQMKDTTGKTESLQELVGKGEYTILYFYTDDCISCRKETPLLVDFVNNYNKSVLNVYAVYTQDKKWRWEKYINDNFYIYNPFVNWVNVWDPQVETGYHMMYNVISTPQIYLIDKNGVIVGRGLNAKALMELVQALDKEQENLVEFLNSYLGHYSNSPVGKIMEGIEILFSRSRDDNKICRELFTELYRFLKNSDIANFKECALNVAKEYIIANPQIWENKFYTDRIAQQAAMMERGRPGTVVSSPFCDIAGDYKVLYFYRTGCTLCAPVTEKLRELEKYCREKNEKNIEFIAVDLGQGNGQKLKFVGNSQTRWHDVEGAGYADEIYEGHYLEMLPSIYLLDSNNRVIKRNMTIGDLKNTLQL